MRDLEKIAQEIIDSMSVTERLKLLQPVNKKTLIRIARLLNLSSSGHSIELRNRIINYRR